MNGAVAPTSNDLNPSIHNKASRRERRTAIGDVNQGASFYSQFKALSAKTMTYQKRQKCQSACLCCFPIFCIAMLLLVQMLLNNLNPTKEYDFTCINDKVNIYIYVKKKT